MRKWPAVIAATTIGVLVGALTFTPFFAFAENGGVGGQQFHLAGTATDDVDPENPTNDVISFNTTPATFAAASRATHKGTKIEMLDNQVQLKYLFVNRTCSGGAPRISLGIDRNGDGTIDGNAFGYLGDKPFGGGCPPGEWIFEDMTNDQAKWDLSQLQGPMAIDWDGMEAFIQGAYPSHQVLRGTLVDDSCSFAPTSCGRVYFDNVVIGNQEIDDHLDTTT